MGFSPAKSNKARSRFRRHHSTNMGMNVCALSFNGSLGMYIAYATSHFSKEKAEESLALCLRELASYEVKPQEP